MLMKKFSFIVMTAALLAMAMPAAAQADDLYLLHEGFENGMPAAWSQENVSGSTAWAVETNGTYPTGASEGTGRAYLRNESNQTLGFVTRLITPVLDISQVYQPILVFDHAQAQRTGDVDMLRVFYRTSASASWVFLKEFSEKISNWQTDTIALPGASATYQIAFEATDRLGRGVVIDEVRVRPRPTCTTPYNISISTLGTNEATLAWNGSLDADSFRVVVAKRPLTVVNPADSAVIINATTGDFTCDLKGLDARTTYYVYILSLCYGENSDWGAFAFTTLNRVDLPYEFGFNAAYVSGIIQRDDNWTYGTSMLNDAGNALFTPYINTNVTEANWRYYSPDTTTSLWFNGALTGTLGRTSATATNEIPAGYYAYAASPEINVASLQTVQASFWITAYNSVNGYYIDNTAAGIVVGAMTDPSDWNTFVPVDTFYAKVYGQFAYCVADFADYTGQGKYIAFASNFLQNPNAIALDKITFYEPAAPTPAPKLRAVSPFSFTVDAGVAADSYNVKIAKDMLASNAPVGAAPLDTNVLATLTPSSKQFSVPAADYQAKFVNVYVQAVKNGTTSAWSEPLRVQVPGIISLPTTYTFDEEVMVYSSLTRANRVWQTSTNVLPDYVMIDPNLGHYTYIPRIYSAATYATSGSNVLYWYYGCGAICFPYIDTVSNIILTYNDVCTSSSYVGNGTIEVGVIDSPDDFSTFTKVAEFTPEYPTVSRRMVDFSSYTGNGHYVAFRMKRELNSTPFYAYIDIDDVTFMKRPECMFASDMVAFPDAHEALIAWHTNGTDNWAVACGKTLAAADTIVAHTSATGADSTAATVTGLQSLKTYYYKVGAVCGTDTTWSYVDSFVTTCPAAMDLPYLETFEGYRSYTSTSYGYDEIPTCWTMPQYHYSTYAYGYTPHIYEPSSATSTYIYDGAMLVFGTYYASTNTSWQDTVGTIYFALPKMNAPITSLQLSFVFRSYSTSYYGDTIEVGVMTDPEDMTTFTPWKSFYITQANVSTTYQPMKFDFYGYNGPDGHIAMRKNPKTSIGHIILIDNVAVTEAPNCIDIDDVEIKTVTFNGISLDVNTRMGSTFEVAIHDQQMNEALIGTNDHLVYQDTFNTPNIVIADTAIYPANSYVAYVRTLCSATDHSDWYGPIKFTTPCEPYAVDEFNTAYATISSANQLLCWNVGLRAGTTEVPSYNSYYGGSIKLYTNAASEGAYAITPELAIDSIKNYSITFSAVTNQTTASYYKKLTVGVITDPYDLATFVAMKTIDLGYVSSSATAKMGTANIHTIRFSNYVGDYNEEFGKRVMFILESGDDIGYAFIQGFHLDLISPCERPINIDAQSTAHEANIVWEGASTQYHVLMSTASISTANIDSTKLVLDTVVSAPALALEGLLAATDYYLNIQPVCASGEGVWSYEYQFTTECEPFQLPFEEDFGSYVTGTGATATFPACWTRHHVGTTTNYPSITTYGNGDSKSLYMYQSTSYKVYAVLPRAGVPVTQMEMSFDYRANSGSPAQGAIIGVAKYAAPFDSLEATFQPVDTLRSLTTTWAEKIINFSTFTGEGEFIVFKSSGTSTCIDNIYIYALPTCMYPLSADIDSVGTSSAVLKWVGQGTNFDVFVTATAGTDTTFFSTNASPFKFTGLTPNTDYSVGVRQHCSDEDQSRWVKASLHTAIATPYEEIFADGIPAGWMLYNQLIADVFAGTPLSVIQTSGRTASWTAINAGKGITGMHAVNNLYGTTKHSWLVSPPIACQNIEGLTLAFDAAYTKYNSDAAADGTRADDRFIVAVSDDAGLTWDSIHAFEWNNAETGDYVLNDIPATAQRYKLNFDAFAGKTIRIAFYVESTVSNGDNDLHIGNITLQQELCDAPAGAPTVVDSTITTTSALLTWAPDSAASYYRVVVVNDMDTVFNAQVTDTAVLVNGLAPGTSYMAYLSMSCPNGGMSAAAVAAFKTQLAVPFTETFENGVPSDWSTYKQRINLVFNGTPLDTLYTPTRTTGWIKPATSYVLPKDHIVCNIFGTTICSWLVSPVIKVDSTENLTLSFDAAYTKYNNETPAEGTRVDDRFIVAVSEDGGASWSAANATIWNNTGDGDYVLNSITNAVAHFSIDMDKYQGKPIRIAFYGESFVTGNGDNDFHLANVSLKGERICYPPMSLSAIADSLDAHNMAFKWSGKKVRNFEYEFLQDTALLASGTTTDTILAFHNLLAKTDYTLRVRTLCDSAFYSDWSSLTVRTECDIYTMAEAKWYFDDLELGNEISSGTYRKPNCWEVGNQNSTSVSYIPYVYPTTESSAIVSGYDGKYGLRMANYGNSSCAYVILPAVEGSMDTMQLAFWGRAGYQSAASGTYTDYGYPAATQGRTLIIGSVVGDDISTFQPITTWTYPNHAKQVSNCVSTVDPEGTNYWRFVTAPLYGATGTNVCIMLDHTGVSTTTYDYMFLDNIEIQPCHCVLPLGAKVVTLLPDLVEVAWNAPADSFVVAMGGDTLRIDTAFIAFPNLVPDSAYSLSIAAKCEDGLSDWVSLDFQTPCGYAVPDSLGRYAWNFDNRTDGVVRTQHATSDSYLMPECWLTANTGATSASYDPYIYPTSTTSAYVCGYDGKYGLYMYGYSTSRSPYAVLPAINGLDSMQLSFWARAGYQSTATGTYVDYASSTYGHSLIIGTVSNPNSFEEIDTLFVYTAPDHDARVTSLVSSPDPAGTNYWRKVNVPLAAAKNKYIIFMLPKVGASYDYMFLDNIQVKVNHCMMPNSLVISDVTATTASLSWKGDAATYRLAVNGIDTVLNDTTFQLAGLMPNTTYSVAVTAICSEDEESDALIADFRTSIALPYYESLNTLPGNWTRYNQLASTVLDKGAGALATEATSGWIANTTTNGLAYNHIKGNIYGTSWRYWFVSPAITLDSLPNLALAFDAALTDYNNGLAITSDPNGQTGVDDRFMVVISDDGGNTWKTANATIWNNTGDGDYIYNDVPYDGERYYIDLMPYIGKTIKVAFYGESTVSNADNDFHIGNVSIQSESCMPLRKLQGTFANNQLALTWLGAADTVQLQVASEASFADSVMLTDVRLYAANSYSFAAEYDAAYYYRVRAICDSVNTSDWTKSSCITPKTIRFFEGMSVVSTVPEGWTRTYNKKLDQAANGLGSPADLSSTYAWRFTVGGNGISSNHLVVSPYATASYASQWIASPQIYLNATDSVMLSFNAALTEHSGSAAPVLVGTEQFAVVVSADGGLTWDIANATVWSSEAGARSLAAVPARSTRMLVDLSRYAGQTVKVAFYAFGGQSGYTFDIHIDNIQINAYEGVHVEQALCQYEDFTYADVTIDESRLPIGESTWYQFLPANAAGRKDTYNTFVLNVTEAVVTPLYDRVCYGGDYNQYGFNLAGITDEGVYKLKLHGVNTCDSIAELHLSIIPASYGADSATICMGQTYTWHGKSYTNAGIYADTIPSVAGCDSIVSLLLTVNEPDENESTVYLCPNSTLDFDGQTITAPGQYTKTYTNIHGCDSIVIWNVVAGKVETTLRRHLLCPGDTYTDENFVGIGVAGDYTVTVPSFVTGCDSILALHLIAVQNGEATDRIEVAELPYEIDGNVLLPVGTAEGTYDLTANTTCGSVTLHVIVGKGQGIDNISYADLSIAPNPVKVGESTQILTSFGVGEQFTLEVFDATGAMVHSEAVTTTRAAITVPGMPTAGIYMVRLTGDKQSYQAKLIVR